MKSGYTALSISLRATIPHKLKLHTTAINNGFKFTTTKLFTFKATVHEHKMGALRLAQLEPGRNTPQSKLHALELHWFCSWLKPQRLRLHIVQHKTRKLITLSKALH